CMKTTDTTRRGVGREEWAKRVERWRDSGLTDRGSRTPGSGPCTPGSGPCAPGSGLLNARISIVNAEIVHREQAARGAGCCGHSALRLRAPKGTTWMATLVDIRPIK